LKKWPTAHPKKSSPSSSIPLTGLGDAQAKKIADAIGMPADSTAQAADIFKKLYKCYMDTDASLVEINPLNLRQQRQCHGLGRQVQL
jgi:succinyl-CoA synthetase beta subunit